MHSFRVGAAVAKAIAGEDIARIIRTVGWKSERVATRYVGQVSRARIPAASALPVAESDYAAANDLAATLDSTVWGVFDHNKALAIT